MKCHFRTRIFTLPAPPLVTLLSLILLPASPSWCAVTITHGPRLGLVTSNEATIYWDTDQSEVGRVEWGTSQSYGSSKSEDRATTAHRLTITDLAMATTYHYRVATGSATSEDHTFSTAVPPETEFTFISMADNRGPKTADDVIDLPAAFHAIVGFAASKKASFVLHAGDLFHANWDVIDTLYSNFKQATDALAGNTPFLISPGNHEMLQNGTVPPGIDPLTVFNEQFAQPTGPDPLNLITAHYPGSVFSFDWGNSHFVSIDNCRYDTTKPDSGMYQVSDAELSWLENDLQTAQSTGVRHIFVMAHANAFVAPGARPDGMAIYPPERDWLWQILVDYNVDAYITGHVHEFNDEWGQTSDTQWDNGSVVHWMNGDSGSVFDSSDHPMPGFNHWTVWTVNGDTVTARLYNDFGNEVYSRTIQSAQPPTPLASTSPAANAIDVPVDVVITATFASRPPPDTTAFTVTGSANIPIQGAVAFNGDTATFTPSGDLSNAETYTASVATAAMGSAQWSFTTMGGSKASPEAATGTGKIAIDTSSNPGTTIENVIALADTDSSLNQANKPIGYRFADGLVSYNVADVSTGATINVSLTFPSGIPKGSKVYKVNKEGFYEFREATINGSTVTLSLTDGGAGDDDGVVDGKISDPVGIAAPTGTPVTPGGGGGCVVAAPADGSCLFLVFWLSAAVVCVEMRRRCGTAPASRAAVRPTEQLSERTGLGRVTQATGRRIDMQPGNGRWSNRATHCGMCLRKRWSREIAAIVVAAAVGASLFSGCGDDGEPPSSGPVGWAIGTRNQDGSAVILHTANGGSNWDAQGDTSLWTGHCGTDISAVDHQTAWAALCGFDSEDGLILHTMNGGLTWAIQTLPGAVPGGVKGIKGLSPNEAWAVGIEGPVMHTLDGGQTWVIVPTEGIAIRQVNRMDVLGDDIWIADFGNGERGIIHSADRGRTWRQEQLPSVPAGQGPMAISIVNSQVAWTDVRQVGGLYRTRDSGLTWNIDAPDVTGPHDIDDLCAVNEDTVWAVQNAAPAGIVLRVSLSGSQVDKKEWNLPYVYEGVSAFDKSMAWIVGFKGPGGNPSLPDGSILRTSDGETWTSQPLPVNNVGLWKVSFVGAHR
jgi:photosystem II stability/assembly factor-like uncharacterized protein